MYDAIDYLVAGIIDLKLNELSENPHYIAHILKGYSNPIVAKISGQDYIMKATKYLSENRIHVTPAFALDKAKKPVIVVHHSGSENLQFIGDHGFREMREINPPFAGPQFRPSALEGNNMLKVSSDYDITTYVKGFKYVGTGGVYYRVTSLFKNRNDYMIEVDKPIDPVSVFRDWFFYTAEKDRQSDIGVSVDDINMTVNLYTNGDASMHRLIRTITRAVLKSARPLFEVNGFMVTRISYSDIVSTDGADTEFMTSFNLNGKASDSWIMYEHNLPNKMEICLEAESTNPENDEVFLGSTTIHI